MTKAKPPCIIYVSSFPPRACGIATFTQDLTNAIDKEFNPGIKGRILAVNDNSTSIYNYSQKVKWNLHESEIEDYINCANLINKAEDVKLVNIQHEYGLHGGEWGDYLLPFLELLNKPVVTTLHTVLPNPPEKLLRVTKGITNRSEKIIVMTGHAAKLLHDAYGVPKSKINIIPHGVHHIPFPSKSKAKKKLNLSEYTVLSTFGMLNRDKGIEYAIAALPDIVEEFPNVLYLIIGATHPNIVKREGEKYRNKLHRLVLQLGLKDNVKFYNKYVTLAELIDYLKATDIYISPTLNPKQAVSGTISYALSCACPIIATANQYAVDTITPERGALVGFRNASAIKKALQELFKDRFACKEMGKNAYFYSRHMTWQNVALSYFKIFNEFAKIVPRRPDKLPPINLRHIQNLTDKFGIIQFARHTKPDIFSGYNLDDNARALLGLCHYYEKRPSEKILKMLDKYFKMVKFCQKKDGRFYNFLSYNRKFIDKSESEDSFGRAIWSLGGISGSLTLPEYLRRDSRKIINRSLPLASGLNSLRAQAFTILGLCQIAKQSAEAPLILLIKRLADKLVRRAELQAKNPVYPDWIWFEDCLTYSNSKLPEALFFAYEITNNHAYLATAEKTLAFLTAITFAKDYFEPIGQDGWYFAGGQRSYFDQQPEDVAAAVESYATAWQITGKKEYKELAQKAFAWFLGKNHLNQMVYDEATGGCYDGLGSHSLNFNQGAESTISYFLARLAIEKIQ